MSAVKRDFEAERIARQGRESALRERALIVWYLRVAASQPLVRSVEDLAEAIDRGDHTR